MSLFNLAIDAVRSTSHRPRIGHGRAKEDVTIHGTRGLTMEHVSTHGTRGLAMSSAFVLLAGTLTLALAACGQGRATRIQADAPVPVRLSPVTLATAAPPIRGTGLFGPKDEVSLSFKIGGVVQQVLVENGDRVRKGQALAALDPREIDARVAQAESGAEKAERDYLRAERLYADSVATLEQVQDTETARSLARAALDAATFDRSHSVIVAPSDGVILARSAEPGELVAPGRQVLSFGSRTRGSVVRVGLADRDAVRVRRGDRATVHLNLVPPRVLDGVVAEIAAAADPATGTFRIEIAVPPIEELTSGLVADVEIEPSITTTLSVIPIEAVLEADGQSASVYTVDEATQRALRREITVAFFSGDRVGVASGLEGIDQVVTDGASRLDTGAGVKVLP